MDPLVDFEEATEEVRYEDPGPADRDEALATLEGDDPDLISLTLVRLALHDHDGQWVEEQCWRLADHRDPWVRGTAGLCLGHVARRFRTVRPLSWSIVQRLCDDPSLDNRPCDGLEDMRMFAGPEPTG